MKVLLVLLILFLILLLKNQNFTNISEKENIKKKLYNGDKWNLYRLGDVYNHYDHNYDPNHHENIFYHKYKFEGSIANEYINKNLTNKKNIPLILDIIKKKSIDKSNYPNKLFLHIRVGDVMCSKKDALANFNAPLKYSKKGDTVWWNQILNYIQTNNIKTVVIISGTHLNECLNESAEYIINRVTFLLDKLPYLNIESRLGESPDEDMITFTYVKHFITTGGGYGNLIKEINNNNLLNFQLF